MGKKHLLYIHHPAFSEEEHKSAIVNKLLLDYYKDRYKKGKTNITYAKETSKLPTTQEIENYKANEKIDRLKTPLATERLNRGLCKIHEAPLDSRGKCLQKGCKYS